MFFSYQLLQSLDHAEYAYDAKSKQTTAKTSTTYQQKQSNASEDINRRHARLITNVPSEHETPVENESTNNNNNNQKSFEFESFEDSLRRFQTIT